MPSGVLPRVYQVLRSEGYGQWLICTTTAEFLGDADDAESQPGRTARHAGKVARRVRWQLDGLVNRLQAEERESGRPIRETRQNNHRPEAVKVGDGIESLAVIQTPA